MGKNGKSKLYKAQHFVPQCYLKAWHDPNVRPGDKVTPFVWHFEKDGSNPRRKAPANIFKETDIYTIKRADGERELHLEHGLQSIEDRFTRIRNLRFARREWPDAEELTWVHAFVATAQVRTAGIRDFHREQLSGLIKMGESMEHYARQATPELRADMARMGRASPRQGSSMTLDDIRSFKSNPIQPLIVAAMKSVLPIMGRMHTAILCTDEPIGFVTTDQPCTWYDPESYKRPPMYQAPGILMSTIEITLPISPKQCLVLTHRSDLQGYIEIDTKTVGELNRRHIAHCNNHFISCSSETQKFWFEQPPLPDDAWEVVRERKIATGEWPE